MANRIVKIVLRGDISGYAASMKSAAGLTKNTIEQMTSAQRQSAKFRAGLTTVGTAATRAGLVAAAGVGLITKAAIDWESAWAGVTKTINGTPAQLSAIESGLRSMARELPASHEELAGIAEAAGQLGVATPNVLAFTHVMADLAQTTNLTAEEAATSIAQFMNVMQTAPEDVDNLGAALVALGNNGASTERDIIQMAQNIAGAGAIVGASEADILALSNALASVGIEAAAGGSSVSKILIDMSTAVQTNSADLKTWASTAGQTTEQFAQSFRDDPIAAFDAFTQGLGRINDAGGDVFSLLQDLGQSDIRVTRALLGMANSGDLLSKSLALGSKEWERNKALAAEAEQRYDTTAAKVKIAWNNIKDAAIDAGQGMLPVVSSIAQSISSVTSAFGKLSGPVKSSVGVLGGFSAASLLAVGGGVKLINTITSARTAMDNLGLTMPKTAGAIGRVTKAAGFATAAFVALKVAGNFLDSGNREGVSKYASAILDLGQSAKGAKGQIDSLFKVEGPGNWILSSYGDIKNLDDAISAIHPGKLRQVQEGIQGIFTETRKEAAEKSFAQFDSGLRSLADSGALDEAAAGFKYVSAAMRDSGFDTKEIARIFPQYSEVLQEADNKQRIAGDSASDLGDKLANMSPEAKKAQEEMEAFKKSLQDSSDSFLDFGAGLDGAQTSFQDWIGGLEKMATAQQNWADNMIKAAARGVDEGVLAKIQEQGPKAAGVLEDLANGSEKNIARVNDALGSVQASGSRLADALAEIPREVLTQFSAPGADGAAQKAIYLAERYNLTPDQVKTIMEALDYASEDIDFVQKRLGHLDVSSANPTIDVNDRASRKIDIIRGEIAGLHDKTINITTIHTRSGAGGSGRTVASSANGNIFEAYADGGLRATSENHVAQIASPGVIRMWNEPEAGGEAYIPFAQSNRRRSQQIAIEAVSRLGGVAQFAGGGIVNGTRGGDGAQTLTATLGGPIDLTDASLKRLASMILDGSRHVADGRIAANTLAEQTGLAYR